MASLKSMRKILLEGAYRVLTGLAILSFLLGGRLIHGFTKTDFVTAELEGIGVAGVCLILGVFARHIAEAIPDSHDDGNTTSFQK